MADAVSSVMVSMFLAERVHELEASADRKALREMELLKAELLSTVSHELRRPLASIKGYAATLLRHERHISREERHEFLIAITDASDRLEAVINRLLEMSQLETGSISLERTTVNLAHLAREAITAVERRFGEAGQREDAHQTDGHMTFTLRLEDSESRPTRDEPLIQTDRRRLREVLDNLLENAVMYSPGGGVVEVGIRPVGVGNPSTALPASSQDKRNAGRSTIPPVQATPPLIEIWVRDTGIGIPAKYLERIFERFHRVDTRLTREVNGLGLGLAIFCKRIVELHDGTIWAESTPAKGVPFISSCLSTTGQ
jgi:signal transduction histidine kinase